MSKVIERRFDVDAGAVIVTIEDQNGTRSIHTIHVLEPSGKEADVKKHIADRLREARIRARKVRRLLRKHGWKP